MHLIKNIRIYGIGHKGVEELGMHQMHLCAKKRAAMDRNAHH